MTLAERIRPVGTALLMIDFSNDFVDPAGKAAVVGGRDVSPARGVLPVAAELLIAARAAGVTVVHCQHTTLRDGASDSPVWRDARSRAGYSAPDICLDGTWGQEIVAELRPEPGDHVVRKFRYGAFTGTQLELLLRSKEISTVVCVGVSTNVCVDTTMREAFSREFAVVVAADACASWDMTLHDAALRTAGQRFAVVSTSHDIVAAWSPDRSVPPTPDRSLL
ncbi:MAG: cysteine hydrolase [Kibdelosporangium sp.]